MSSAMQIFQSTHPVWGATDCSQLVRCIDNISIHAPRVGCDGSTLIFAAPHY